MIESGQGDPSSKEGEEPVEIERLGRFRGEHLRILNKCSWGICASLTVTCIIGLVIIVFKLVFFRKALLSMIPLEIANKETEDTDMTTKSVMYDDNIRGNVPNLFRALEHNLSGPPSSDLLYRIEYTPPIVDVDEINEYPLIPEALDWSTTKSTTPDYADMDYSMPNYDMETSTPHPIDDPYTNTTREDLTFSKVTVNLEKNYYFGTENYENENEIPDSEKGLKIEPAVVDGTETNIVVDQMDYPQIVKEIVSDVSENTILGENDSLHRHESLGNDTDNVFSVNHTLSRKRGTLLVDTRGHISYVDISNTSVSKNDTAMKEKDSSVDHPKGHETFASTSGNAIRKNNTVSMKIDSLVIHSKGHPLPVNLSNEYINENDTDQKKNDSATDYLKGNESPVSSTNNVSNEKTVVLERRDSPQSQTNGHILRVNITDQSTLKKDTVLKNDSLDHTNGHASLFRIANNSRTENDMTWTTSGLLRAGRRARQHRDIMSRLYSGVQESEHGG